ncbi:MAG TPA: efflux transporter outer membrane subunit [Rhizomicrobium sp.]|nr:efflux transporter outer membrane subunit [Rhizomicrobium sp.]
MKLLLQSASVVALAVALAACQTEVPQVLAPKYVPSNFSSPTVSNAQIWPAAEWWKSFNSDEMTGFVASAQTDNLDMAAAAARVLEAEQQTDIARSALFPTIDLEGNAQRGKSSTTFADPITHKTITQSVTGNNFSLTGNATYEIDLWGKARANLRSADELLKASQYAQEVVALTTVSAVATTYLDVLALRERIEIAHQNEDAAKRILTIVQAKVANGVSSRLDLAQQQAVLAAVQSAIPPLEEQEREARYALAILLGRVPEGLVVEAKNLNGIAVPTVAPGLPSELLRRRPDVAEAEANLASAHANVDAARAAFFPDLSLTGSGGVTSSTLGSLFKNGAFGWGIGASLLQTIFDGGLLASQYDLTKAQQEELVATYRSTVLNALSDVETTLGQVSSLADEERYKRDQVNASAEAFRISELQYREGVTDLLNLLTAQQTLFTAQDELVQIKLARIQADVGLFKALGGGWSQVPEATTQSLPAQTTPVAAPPPAAAPQSSSTTPVPATPQLQPAQPADSGTAPPQRR